MTGFVDSETYAEGEANARLIAAAPELRKLLAEIIDARDRAALDAEDPAYLWIDKAIDAARALLARIDGDGGQ